MCKTIKNGYAEKRVELLRLLESVHDVAVDYAKTGENQDRLRKAYEAYWVGMDVQGDRQRLLDFRNIIAGRVVIECIHALTGEELDRLESELKRIAADIEKGGAA